MEMTENDSNSDEWNPSLAELIEAVEDEDHLHHDEAVKRNRELAERMRPLLDSFKGTSAIFSPTLTKQLQGFALPAVKLPKMDLSPILKATQQADELMEQHRARMKGLSALASPQISSELACSIQRLQEERVEREKRAEDLLESMVAQITETNRRIEKVAAGVGAVNDSVINLDQNSSVAHRSSMRLNWAVLFVSILGTVITILLFVLDRYI